MADQSSLTSTQEFALLRRASYVSLTASILLLAAKFWAFWMTGSQAVFSDAMESIVNVIAASVSIYVINFARQPADREHPYGHGKAEFVSATFEGGLIAIASLAIIFEAVKALVGQQTVDQPGLGTFVTFATGVANAALGYYLVRTGKKHNSATLIASGRHVFSDFWTSFGVAIGLLLVTVTGIQWLDPVVALLMGALLARTGYGLVRRSLGELLDEEDREILENLRDLLAVERPSGIIQLHHVRVMRSGHYHHIDAHAVVPEYWDVAEAHEKTDAFEAKLMEKYPAPGELHLHVDPCQRAYCRNCAVMECPIRKHPFEKLRELTLEEMTNPEEPTSKSSRAKSQNTKL